MDVITQENLQLILNNAFNIYHYGSSVYGTFKENVSDYDYIVILPDNYEVLNNQQFAHGDSQYSFYTKSMWQKKLDNNDVDAMEIYFLPKTFIVKENICFQTEINRRKIRENFSKTASNSFVKCKKKLEVKNSYNPRIGKKSLWHSLRIIDFGIQILQYGKIINYASLNKEYIPIVENENNDWIFYKEKYKPIYNEMKTKFRIMENLK